MSFGKTAKMLLPAVMWFRKSAETLLAVTLFGKSAKTFLPAVVVVQEKC
jgi:hypothetical protein